MSHYTTYHASALSDIARPRTFRDQAEAIAEHKPLTRKLFSQAETESLVARVSRLPAAEAITLLRDINATEPIRTGGLGGGLLVPNDDLENSNGPL